MSLKPAVASIYFSNFPLFLHKIDHRTQDKMPINNLRPFLVGRHMVPA